MGKKLIRWKVKELATIIKQMQHNKYDCIIVISGNRGTGKSTLAYKLGLNIGGFNAQRDICFTREEVMNSLAKKVGKIIIADEMINVSFNRDFFESEQKDLIKMLNMYRDKKNILLACVPNFATLDKQFLGLTKIRIHVVRRGLAVLHRQKPTQFGTDPWDIKRNEKIENMWYKKNKFKVNYKALSTSFGLLTWNELTPIQEERYQKIKDKKRNEILLKKQEELKKNDPERLFFENLLKRIKDGKINNRVFDEICVTTLKSRDLVSRRLNKMLKDNGQDYSIAFLMKEKEKEDEKNMALLNRPHI